MRSGFLFEESASVGHSRDSDFSGGAIALCIPRENASVQCVLLRRVLDQVNTRSIFRQGFILLCRRAVFFAWTARALITIVAAGLTLPRRTGHGTPIVGLIARRLRIALAIIGTAVTVVAVWSVVRVRAGVGAVGVWRTPISPKRPKAETDTESVGIGRIAIIRISIVGVRVVSAVVVRTVVAVAPMMKTPTRAPVKGRETTPTMETAEGSTTGMEAPAMKSATVLGERSIRGNHNDDSRQAESAQRTRPTHHVTP